MPDSGRELLGSEKFVLVPDYAPLVPGHLLLFTRDHELSIADCLTTDSAGHDDLHLFFRAYLDQYGELAVIEHGSTPDVERAHPCVAHAHLHLLPLNSDDLLIEFEHDIGATSRNSWTEAAQAATGREYVLVGDNESVVLALDWHPPRRQYARTLAGRVLALTSQQIYSDTCVLPAIVSSTISTWKDSNARQSV